MKAEVKSGEFGEQLDQPIPSQAQNIWEGVETKRDPITGRYMRIEAPDTEK